MPQKFIAYRGRKYYLGYTFNTLAAAKKFVSAQRRYDVVCIIKKSPPFYYVYCPYSAKDVIYTKKRGKPQGGIFYW